MKPILKHFKVLNISVQGNPFVTLHLFIANCNEESSDSEEVIPTLCVASVDNIVSIQDLKQFFLNYGNITSFNVIEEKSLSANFKNFAFCIYLTYEEKDTIDLILSTCVHVDELFHNNKSSPFEIQLKSKSLRQEMEDYYYDQYNLFYGKKIITTELLYMNKENHLKRKEVLVDEDGFQVVQNNPKKHDFTNSIFSTNSDEEIPRKRRKKDKNKIHENFYLFRKKDSFLEREKTVDSFNQFTFTTRKKVAKG